MTEPTQAEKCAELAKAMGWQQGESSGVWFSPKDASEICVFDVPPDPFADHEACHALKVWLAAQSPEAWGNFSAAVIDHSIPFDQQAYADWEMVTRAVMTADPAIIAEAAWQSIQKGNSE